MRYVFNTRVIRLSEVTMYTRCWWSVQTSEVDTLGRGVDWSLGGQNFMDGACFSCLTQDVLGRR